MLVASLLVCVAAGYGAYSLAGVSWDAVVSYESPYAKSQLPAARPQAAVASRTVLVIIDGLRDDASRRMGTLQALRTHGSAAELIAPQPSLSYPNWTTILSGTPPYISGVVTNWHEGAAPVETIFDTAKSAGVRVVFAGPEDFEPLYGIKAKTVGNFMKKWDKEYLSAEYVDAALRMAEKNDPGLIVVHLPDVDEAGHDFGAASKNYADVVSRVDSDLSRLVSGLQDGRTAFVIVADHGHIDSGGHGGWEPSVVRVSAALAGSGTNLGVTDGRLEDIAPTVAVLAGIGIPRYASGVPLAQSIGSQAANAPAVKDQQRAVQSMYSAIVSARQVSIQPTDSDANLLEKAQAERLAADRRDRLMIGLAGLGASLLALALVALVSWRALVAALVGTVGYYALYNVLFFPLHGYKWSLSAFNSEDMIDAWMNLRLAEAALSMLFAAAVAAAVYPMTRKAAKGPKGEYLAGWLSLGPATTVVILATLGAQVAWFAWWWGVIPQWRLPDLMWGFKYDLDLIQATAVGFAALVTPLVTYLIGRYHPKVRRDDNGEAPPASGDPAPVRPLVPAGVGSAAAEE